MADPLAYPETDYDDEADCDDQEVSVVFTSVTEWCIETLGRQEALALFESAMLKADRSVH